GGPPGAGGAQGGADLIGAARSVEVERLSRAQNPRLEAVTDHAVATPVSAPVAYGSNSIRFGQETNAVPVAYGSNGTRFGQEGNAFNAGTASPFQKVREGMTSPRADSPTDRPGH